MGCVQPGDSPLPVTYYIHSIMKKMYRLLLFLTACPPLPLVAQTVLNFADLKLAFEKAPSDTAKLRILFSENPVKFMQSPDELLELYRQGYILAKRQNDKTNRFKAIHYTALVYMYAKTDENMAYQWLQKALPEAEASQKIYLSG